jgi:hypothetical protein
MRPDRLLAWLLVGTVVVAPVVGSDTPGSGRWVAEQYLDGPDGTVAPEALSRGAGAVDGGLGGVDPDRPGRSSTGADGSTVNGSDTDTDTDTDTGAGDSRAGANARSVGLASGSGDVLGTREVHDLGITGQRVRVGVVGESFAVDHGAIDGSVSAHRRLAPATPLPASSHDTAVAEVVAETAPDADLYLVAIGRQPTAARYEQAVDWLVANNVDVVVDAGSYFPRDPAAAERITAAAERATAQGVVFVTSAGNYARRHWVGAGTTSGWVTVADTAGENATQANFLADGRTTGGAVSLRLRWNGSADYDLYLYRQLRGPDRVVAKSAAEGDRPESIDVAVPSGRYYVAIHARNGTPTDRLELYSARQSLAHGTAGGSVVAPATGDAVIAVGAATPDGSVAAYSSRGPSVDVVGPGTLRTRAAGQFRGSSAAAPFVAGTAALMRSRDASLSPAEIERILERSVDPGSGTGVDPLAAVRRTGGDEPGLRNESTVVGG